jgi:hypothetical protein
MKHNPQGITTAMQLYFSGESLRNTAHSLQLIGMDVTHQTVYNWIKKYTKLMETYLNRIIPKVGDAWRTDELHIKVHGNMKYMYALMDDQARFWIAQQVADSKFSANITPLFRKAKLIAGKRPSVLISDGAPNFWMVGGQGYAQRCVGHITVEFSDIDNSATVWEHSALREYNIGTHMGLRLFKVEDNSILFPAALGHMISGFVENRRPLDVFRNKQIMVEVSFLNGQKPEPYTNTISNIISRAS